VDFVGYWSHRTGIAVGRFLSWLSFAPGKFYEWKMRYGKENRHNSWIPRDFWLEDWEKQAIVNFYGAHRTDGYRRATFMMLDSDIVAVSPATVYRVLKEAGALRSWNRTATGKGTGFHQPRKPHEHWHTDVSYLNIRGTFYYLLSILDGYSRYIVHWEIRESMTEADVEIIIQRALEKFPRATARMITDNGPQFIARDFKEFIRISGMTHVTTRPFYPQSNGKIERWHQALKSECIRPKTPLSIEDARRLVAQFVEYYNHVRLHSAIGYIAPFEKLNGREAAIFTERDRKLAAARKQRKIRRQTRIPAALQQA
jgi:transposase InsO family protein